MSTSPLAAATAALRAAREALGQVDPWSAPPVELGEQIGALQIEIDALTGTACRWTGVFAEQDGPADAGAGSLATWLRRELRVTGHDARRRVRTGRVLASLPATAKALEHGQIGIDQRTLCDQRLRNGVPTDHGHRPHLIVTVTGDKLTQTGPRRHQPALLHGFGTIGDGLLGQLACEAEQTQVTIDASGHVLDVGRTKRLATWKQRVAVYTRQQGICAAPGCHNTHLEIHHLDWWSHGGNTDLNDLAGYCTRCHHLIHQRLLVVTRDPAGNWTHQDRRRQRLDDRTRDAERANRDHLDNLARQIFNPPDHPVEPDHGTDRKPPTDPIDPQRLHDQLQRHRRRLRSRFDRHRRGHRWRYPRRDD